MLQRSRTPMCRGKLVGIVCLAVFGSVLFNGAYHIVKDLPELSFSIPNWASSQEKISEHSKNDHSSEKVNVDDREAQYPQSTTNLGHQSSQWLQRSFESEAPRTTTNIPSSRKMIPDDSDSTDVTSENLARIRQLEARNAELSQRLKNTDVEKTGARKFYRGTGPGVDTFWKKSNPNLEK